jgi:hypothetical protein
MNTQDQNGYMLLFRGNAWLKNLSSEDKQKVTNEWMAWFRRLMNEGRAIAGNPLESEGKIVFLMSLPWTKRWRLHRNALDCPTARVSRSGLLLLNVPSQAKLSMRRSSRTYNATYQSGFTTVVGTLTL